jgi:ceramide glucosyltransferase
MTGASLVLLLSVATLLSVVYLAVVLGCVARLGARRPAPIGWRPPVTVLKPLCGIEPLLEENLRSFCTQDYPEYEVVFGVRTPDDPAAGVVDRLAAEGHRCRLELVVDGRMSGPNAKVSNLANMHEHAKHDVIVVSDSDMRVDANWLASVVAPLADPAVGLVTCPYRAHSLRGLPSALGAMHVNEWFAPAVAVAASFGAGPFGFGSTLALRQETLEALGGFKKLSEYIADDYVLAARVVERGQRIVLSDTVVEMIINEPGIRALFAHEVRWARVVRSVRPLGWTLSCLTYPLPLALASCIASGFTPASTALLGLAATLRLAVHALVPSALGLRAGRAPWLVPLRDALSLAVWATSFFGSAVEWRGRRMSVGPGGLAGGVKSARSC